MKSVLVGCSVVFIPFLNSQLTVAEASPAFAITVNSNEDAIAPNDELTLREAIALANGSLNVETLTESESNQIAFDSSWQINFDLPPEEQRIELKTALPPLQQEGLSLKGDVTLTSAPETVIPQGLQIMGDNITVSGLTLYGFSGAVNPNRGFPSADILIAPPEDNENPAPTDIVIENTQLGIASDARSNFGIVIVAGTEVTIRKNQIQHHGGSGLLTMINSANLTIRNNVIAHNGSVGMADGIRLGGKIDGTRIINNEISHNGGSGIFLFKPDGRTVIENNQLIDNSQRLTQAAIYLMGNDHQVQNNEIDHRRGAGVVVAGTPTSLRNRIEKNRFLALEGLSIDLVTRRHDSVRAYRNGDGVNPQRDSANRNLDTGNRGMATPEFLAPEFYLFQEQVAVDGVAMPHAEVTLYRVGETQTNSPPPLIEPIAYTKADAEGKFSFELKEMTGGEKLSAIATHPDFGTSEPASSAVVRTLTSEKQGGKQ